MASKKQLQDEIALLQQKVAQLEDTLQREEAMHGLIRYILEDKANRATNAKDANASLVAEGLYNAAKACEAWGELPSCKLMAGRLRGRLKLRKPYSATSWASKK